MAPGFGRADFEGGGGGGCEEGCAVEEGFGALGDEGEGVRGGGEGGWEAGVWLLFCCCSHCRFSLMSCWWFWGWFG